MQKHQISKFLLSMGLAASLLTTGSMAAFSDTTGHWAEGAIAKWSESYHIINGYEDGTFHPDHSITRGAFAGILDRFMHFREKAPSGTFSDLSGNYWENEILKLNAAGVYLGNGGKALPNHTITRQQAVAMIGRTFQLPITAQKLPYQDADQISEYARGYVAELTARGCLGNDGTKQFRPLEPITRAEIVSILDHLVELLIQNQGTYTQNVSGTVMINAAGGATLKDMTIGGDLIVAPGVTGPVLLDHVQIKGTTQNFSSVKIQIQKPKPVPKPEPKPDPKPDPKPSHPDYPWIEPEGYLDFDQRKVPLYPDVEQSHFGPGDFHWQGDRLVYDGGRFDTRFGIDVSAYQNRASEGEEIDWKAVKADGVDFAMVRVGLRGYSTGGLLKDAFYGENIEGAMDAGIETGVYIFSQAITVEEAVEEADFVINLLKNHKIDGPVAYDWEMGDSTYRVYGIEPEVATACAVAFCQRIEKAGYDPIVYMSKYVGYNKFNLPQLKQYPIWFPEYKTAGSQRLYPAFYYHPDIWQFSSDCHVDGIGGRVDGNIQFIR